MNRNRLIKTIASLAMFAPAVLFSQVDRQQCEALTKANNQCKNMARISGIHCHVHDTTYVKAANVVATVCNGTKKDGNPCSMKTKHVSGLCHHHRNQ